MREVFTPWRSETELMRVREGLYGNATQCEDATQCVEMWVMRGNCPHAITSTAALASALQEHETEQWNATRTRMLLAAAFARFVTGFCDLGQGSSSRTGMGEVARQYGMPASFIALRHEAAHRELPSLGRLERACREGLDWLWRYYWAPIGRVGEVDASALKQIETVFNHFLQERKQEIRNGGRAETAAAAACCSRLLVTCNNKPSREFGRAVAGRLARKGTIMIPKKRAVGDSMEGAFELFDALLRRVGSQFSHSLAYLVDDLTHRLMRDDGDGGIDEGQREGIWLWLEHVFTERRWRKSRVAGQIQARRRAVVERCSMGWPRNRWSDKLCARLVESAPADFRETMAMHAERWERDER